MPTRLASPQTPTHAPHAVVRSRASLLADRLQRGARALAEVAGALTEMEWRMPLPADTRTVGVVVHHVASVYPLEMKLALSVASGVGIIGITSADLQQIYARHSAEYRNISKKDAIELLRINSDAAAVGIRTLTDAQLDSAASISLYADAPVTCQFLLEDHAVRHSYHHLAQIRAAIGR